MLLPFKLNYPRGEFDDRKLPFSQGGCIGNRCEKINDLVCLPKDFLRPLLTPIACENGLKEEQTRRDNFEMILFE